MSEHLGYERHAVAGRGSGNSRNGSTPKTVTTEIGEVDLRVPRDRAGTFCPVTVPKHRRRLDGLSGNVISLYAKGLTTGEIQDHLAEIYDTSVSRETIPVDHRRDRRRHGGVAEPHRSTRSMRCWVRRDRRQGPRLPGRQQARLCGHRRGSSRRTRRIGHVAGPIGRRGRQAVGHDADRAAKPGSRRRFDRVLRRPQGPALGDPGDLARSDGSDVRGAHGPQQPAVRVPQALEPDHQGHARHLCTSATVEAAQTRFAQFADDWEDTLPRDDPVVAQLLGRVRAVRGVPRRAAQSRLYHQRHRKPQRQIPTGSAPSRTLPQRTGRDESPPASSPPPDARTEPTSPARPTAGKPS